MKPVDFTEKATQTIELQPKPYGPLVGDVDDFIFSEELYEGVSER